MYGAGAELSEELRDLGQASWALSDVLEVESPRAQDQELYQSLAEAARGSDLEKLLSISDAHLTELSCINAAFALIRAARMVEAERKKDKELKDKPLNTKLLNLIRHVESIVIVAAHRRRGFDSKTDADLEDSSSDESKVEDQGLHMAWTLSSISWALGLLGYRNEELLVCLASLVKPRFPHFSPHQLQNCLWAFASLGMKDPGPFFGVAVETIEERIHEFSNESIVAILTSFATVKVFSSNLFGTAAEVLSKENSLIRPQDIANCTWAFATAGHSDTKIFSGLSALAVQNLHDFHPEQVALLVWAFSSVRFRSEELFEAVKTHVAERYTEFLPDSLANVLQAFALMGHPGSQVILEAAADHILANLQSYTPKALSKVTFTIGQTSGYVNLRLTDALAEAFVTSMNGMSASLLTATLMSFSKVKLGDAQFFQKAAQKVAPFLADFDSSGFVRIAKVFSQANIDPAFVQEITEEAMERIPTLRAFELVILTKAMLAMSQAPPHLLESLAEHGSSVLPQMSQKELASFIRSLSAMGLTSASSTGEATFRQAALKAARHLMSRKEDRKSKTSEVACLSRAFARAACATGPVADKFQAAGAEPPSELLEAIRGFLQAAVKEVHAHLDEFRASPSCLVGVLWAASQCDVPCGALTQVAKTVLLPADAGGCDTHVQRLQLPELAELVQALTSLGVDAPELYQAISDKAMQCLQEDDKAETKVKTAEEQLVPASELLRFLATAGLLASALARTTSEKVVQVLAEANAGKLKIPAWVIARCIAGLAISPPAEATTSALKVLASAAAARTVELLPEERALIFWSLSLHGCYEAIFDSMLEETPWTLWAAKPQEEFIVGQNGVPVASGKLMALCQVHLADLALQLEGGRNRKGLSPAQRKHVLEAATLMQRMKKDVSPEEDAICQALSRLDLVPTLGHSSPEGLPLGISVSSPNMRQSRVTIQVDHPGDFLLEIDSSCAHRFPPTTLRRRLLWHLGYTVVVLPWYEVNGCDSEQLQGLLRARLGAVSPPSPSFLLPKGAATVTGARTAVRSQHASQDMAKPEGHGELQVLAADTGGSGDSQCSQDSSSVRNDFELGQGPSRTWHGKQMMRQTRQPRPPGL